MRTGRLRAAPEAADGVFPPEPRMWYDYPASPGTRISPETRTATAKNSVSMNTTAIIGNAFSKIARWRGLCLALALLAAGCGGSPEAGDYPAPGAVKVISVTPVDAYSAAGSLILNGDFTEWWAGSPCPTNFLPPDMRLAEIARVTDEKAKGFAVKQIWKAPDKSQNILKHFRAELKLEPDTDYVFQAAVTNGGRGTPRISMIEGEAGGEEAIQPIALVTLENYPNLFRWYETGFRTQRGGNSVLFTHTMTDEGRDRPEVIWHTMRLFKKGSAPALPDEEDRPVYCAITSPPRGPMNSIAVKAGENLVVEGYAIGPEPITVRYRIESGDWREAEEIGRPDLAKAYPGAAYQTGWKITVPAGDLDGADTLTIAFGDEQREDFPLRPAS
jgi:hypothetical protein